MESSSNSNGAASLAGTLVQIAHEDLLLRENLSRMCEDAGIKVLGEADTCQGLLENTLDKRPDLIITGMHFDGESAMKPLLKLADEEPLPAIIVAREADLDDVKKAMEDHVMAYLVEPVDPRDLQTSCYLVLKRFEQFENLREENKELKQALVTRKKLERAKGIVMEKYDLTEEEACLKIRDVATHKRMKISEVAEIIIRSVEKS